MCIRDRFNVARPTNIIATTSSIKYFGVEAGKRHQTDGTVLGRGKRSEQVGALGLLLELLRQYTEPLTDILWRELLGLPRLGLPLLAHRGRFDQRSIP